MTHKVLSIGVLILSGICFAQPPNDHQGREERGGGRTVAPVTQPAFPVPLSQPVVPPAVQAGQEVPVFQMYRRQDADRQMSTDPAEMARLKSAGYEATPAGFFLYNSLMPGTVPVYKKERNNNEDYLSLDGNPLTDKVLGYLFTGAGYRTAEVYELRFTDRHRSYTMYTANASQIPGLVSQGWVQQKSIGFALAPR